MRRFFLSLSCCLLLGCSSNPVPEETTETSQIETTETKTETTTVEDSFEPVYQVVYTLPDTYLYEDPICQQEVKQLEQGFFGGVDCIASLHAASLEEALCRPQVMYMKQNKMLRVLVQLTGRQAPGEIREVAMV